MVRVVCTNFQPPRSRHSSGETDSIDRDLAKRAAAALSTRSLGRDTGDSEDVSCDSMCDSEVDHTEQSLHFERTGTDENSNSLPGGEVSAGSVDLLCLDQPLISWELPGRSRGGVAAAFCSLFPRFVLFADVALGI